MFSLCIISYWRNIFVGKHSRILEVRNCMQYMMKNWDSFIASFRLLLEYTQYSLVHFLFPLLRIGQSAGAVENTNCISAEGHDLPHHQRVSWYDTKQSDGDVSVILELWGMLSTTSLPLFPSPLGPGVLAPNKALSMGQIELNCVLILNWIV